MIPLSLMWIAMLMHGQVGVDSLGNITAKSISFGKTHTVHACVTLYENGAVDYEPCLAAEPQDVPAVQEPRRECIQYGYVSTGDGPPCVQYGLVNHWTCSDKRRVLLTDESGKRHCILFGN